MTYKLIKLKNNKYSVINPISKKVFSKETSKENATKQMKLLNWLHSLDKRNKKIHYKTIGGKINVTDLYSFMKNGYSKKKDDNINGYKLDNELSGNRVQVYYNPTTNHTIVNHRGTQGINDYITDLRYGLFNYKNSNCFLFLLFIFSKFMIYLFFVINDM